VPNEKAHGFSPWPVTESTKGVPVPEHAILYRSFALLKKRNEFISMVTLLEAREPLDNGGLQSAQ
jgi:hypothetical protein